MVRISHIVTKITFQVKMFYDAPSYQLIITVMGATDLPPRDKGQPRNPYCKLYLLPDRRLVPNYLEFSSEISYLLCLEVLKKINMTARRSNNGVFRLVEAETKTEKLTLRPGSLRWNSIIAQDRNLE